MDLYKAIESRHCKRKFQDKEIKKEILERILFKAGNAASSKNSQPWEVTIVSGKAKNDLKATILDLAENKIEEDPDYIYSTEPDLPEFKERARALGRALFTLKDIKRDDREKRKAHWFENFHFFNAPTLLIFHLHPNAERGNFLDLGLFMQNVMLSIVAEGLGSCPQVSLCSFSKTIKEKLKISQERIMVCGLSVGYVDDEDNVNSFFPERRPLESYTHWIDD